MITVVATNFSFPDYEVAMQLRVLVCLLPGCTCFMELVILESDHRTTLPTLKTTLPTSEDNSPYIRRLVQDPSVVVLCAVMDMWGGDLGRHGF